MGRYEDFQTDDFVQDDYFCHWVINPSSAANEFWQGWIAMHPEQQDSILKARVIVERLHMASEEAVDPALLESTWQQVQRNTRMIPLRRGLLRWSVAAAVGLLVVAMIFLLLPNKPAFITNEFNSPSTVEWMVLKNNSNAVQRLELEDGSVVTLEPKSTLKYPSFFAGKTRSVVLEGEAFFDIARDTTLPFLVYADETVVRVLGTSFFVKAGDAEEEVEVIVKTGKVAVYQRDELERNKTKAPQKKHSPLVVTPNQKVIYEKRSQRMTKRLTSTPSLVRPLSELPQLRFEDRSAKDIFTALESAYGVKIIFLEESVVDCSITTTLTEQTLFEKLDIVCTPLGLQYHEQDASIVISGKCR